MPITRAGLPGTPQPETPWTTLFPMPGMMPHPWPLPLFLSPPRLTFPQLNAHLPTSLSPEAHLESLPGFSPVSNTPNAFALPSCFITAFLLSLIIFCLVLQSCMPLTFSHLEGEFLGNVAETLPFPSLSATVTDNAVTLNTDWPSECCHLRNPWQ